MHRRCGDQVLLIYSLTPSRHYSHCLGTLPVTESAALEEQVAAGDRANLTWLLEPEGTQFRRILKWLISANKSIKTNSNFFAITAWFCANKSNLLPNPLTKQKPGSNKLIFNHACSYYRRCMLHTAPYSIQYVYIVIISETWIINALFLPLRNMCVHWKTSHIYYCIVLLEAVMKYNLPLQTIT